MVDIYLPIASGSPNETQQILALSIPRSDIQRLSISPLRWLRFVIFAVCGAHGDLSLTPGGTPVQYDGVSHANLAEVYYYIPKGGYHLVDHNCGGLDDRMTSSVQTTRRSHFRAEVVARDGSICPFTGSQVVACDAAHIVPRSKGNEYISAIYQDRRHLYGSIPILDDVNSVENGLLLSKTVHAMFRCGHVAFLKTPNFALRPIDIPRVREVDTSDSRITLQHMEPPSEREPIQAVDAHFTGTGTSPPHAILLDYMYGVAAYMRWGAQEMDELMQDRFLDHYDTIPMPPRSPSSSDSSNFSDSSNRSPGRRHDRPDISPEIERAMQGIYVLSMLTKGYTPQQLAAERKRQEEEEELREREAGRAKVLAWMQYNSKSIPSSEKQKRITPRDRRTRRSCRIPHRLRRPEACHQRLCWS